MKKLTFSSLILSFILFSVFCTPIKAENNADGLFVVTFSAPIIEGVNKSQFLYKALLDVITDDDECFADKIDATGALWALTSNLSVVQLAIFAYDKHQAQTCSIYLKEILAKATEIKKSILTAPQPKTIKNLLSAIDFSPPDPFFCPVSLYLNGHALNYQAELEGATSELKDIYFDNKKTYDLPPRIVSPNSPFVSQLLLFNEITFDSFFSAKYIGEKFKKTINNNDVSYEILFANNSIMLILSLMSDEQKLYNSYYSISQFFAESQKEEKPADWENFAENIRLLIAEDLQDFKKLALQKALIKHFGLLTPDLSQLSSINFVAPSESRQILNMPDQYMHDFAKSRNKKPRVSVARLSDDNDFFDATISLTAAPSIIKLIHNTLLHKSAAPLPITLTSPTSQKLLLQFHTSFLKAPALISTIRVVILGMLAEHAISSDELKVTIAAVASQPPYLTIGEIEKAWPQEPEEHFWSVVTLKDVAKILHLSDKNPTALKNRWQLLTQTPRGKSTILAKLSDLGIFITSFDFRIK